MKPIAILGSGPSGILAAWAARFSSLPIAIFSNGDKSRIGGAQFLHRSIPGLTSVVPHTQLTYRVEGDAATYQDKAYPREMPPPFVSFDHVSDGQVVPAWNLREIYNLAWATVSGSINKVRVDSAWLANHLKNYELVISTIPRPAICRDRTKHYFKEQRIRILNECLLNNPDDNTIYYDGTRDHSWYRASNIFGVGSTEWGSNRKLPYKGLVEVTKPVATNCDCWEDSDNLVMAGRFGLWRKGVLTHDAYEGTLSALALHGLIFGRIPEGDPS